MKQGDQISSIGSRSFRFYPHSLEQTNKTSDLITRQFPIMAVIEAMCTKGYRHRYEYNSYVIGFNHSVRVTASPH